MARLSARFLRTGLVSGVLLTAVFAGACNAVLTGMSEEQRRAAEEAGRGEDGPAVKPDLPGFSVIRRLSRLEYQNTVEDLLSTELEVTESFPADDLGEEFATVGSALSLSPLYVMAYERAARDLVEELFASSGPIHDRILTCDIDTSETDECAREIVAPFARRAFRRPLEEGEIETLLIPFSTAAELDASKTDGLKHSLMAVLLSPHFLFKVEAEDDPDSGSARPLTSHEIATRLSYSLWATMPDEALIARADAGDLLSDEAIDEEIERMLGDEKAAGFIESFFAHWLNYARLEAHEVESSVFPDYVPELAASMKEEANHFAEEFLASDRPVQDMLSAKFTYLDERLAQHYGFEVTPSAGEMVRVETNGTERGGLLTLGALLTTTSFSSRTSVVVRGEYVFDHLLCGEIPPPPPGVEGLAFDTEGLTQRERLDLHRQDSSCKGCHEVMDPLGFGLENYDAIGAYRTLDGELPVDASGELPDGETFVGAIELGELLAQDPKFVECVTKKFMTYALGRLVGHKDPWFAYLAEQVDPSETSFRDVLREVLSSEAFRNRQAGPTEDD